MSRTILFLADGTWQNFTQPNPSNVARLFEALAGTDIRVSSDGMERERITDDGAQIARYIDGVGSDGPLLQKIEGGAVGIGLIAQVLRGYTFLSRRVIEGDAVILAGFSRGAYAARTLAALVNAMGLIDWVGHGLAADHTDDAGYNLAARVWIDWQRERQTSKGLAAAIDDFVAKEDVLKDAAAQSPRLRPLKTIRAIGVFDTVGALGIPASAIGADRRVDALSFINTTLSDLVHEAWHAVAADERRGDFTPTLWHRREGVLQTVLAGAHGDCGGGGVPAGESGLADGALQWMAERLASAGVALNVPQAPGDAALGPRHRPEWGFPFAFGGKAWRTFARADLVVSDQIRARLGRRTGVITPLLTDRLPIRTTEIYAATALKLAGLI